MRIAGHVAVSRHVYSFGSGRDVPYWRDSRRARGEGHGAWNRVAVMRVAPLLQELLEL